MFGKKSSPADYRAHTRYSAGDMTILVDGVECDLLDYSDGGVRLAANGHMRRVALIEVRKGDRCIRKTPAIVAWRRQGEIGYAFRSNLRVCEVEGAEQYLPQKRPVDKIRNETGAVSGSALRARLKI